MASKANTFSLKAALCPPKKAEEWTKTVHQIIKSMNNHLTFLFDGLEENSDTTECVEKGLSSDTPLSNVANGFTRHCRSLCYLLSTPSKGILQLPMNSIVDVVSRCIKVSSANLSTRPSYSELAEFLPGVHQTALNLLAQLIVSCGSFVLPRSHSIVDMALSALAGAKHTKSDPRCVTRAEAFRVISLMVSMFGWGRYLQSVSKVLVQDLVADVHVQNLLKMEQASTAQQDTTTTPVTGQDVEQISQRKGKKKRRGKKALVDSYGDLSVPGHESKELSAADAKLVNVDATREALMLSRLVLERADFSQTETLVRCLLDTSRTLQREGTTRNSPYKGENCRQLLYAAVFSCAATRLGINATRKETISHFQASNLALSLLKSASTLDTSHQIRDSCAQMIVVLRSISSINPPVVRKLMSEDYSEVRDVCEVEREVERLSEEKKDLQKSLVDAQIELESQRRELEALRQAAKDAAKQGSSTTVTVINGNGSVNGDDVLSEEENKMDEDEEEEETEESVEKEDKQTSLEANVLTSETGSKSDTTSKEKKGAQSDNVASPNQEKPTAVSKESPSSLKASKKKQKKKRGNESESDTQDAKKLKTGENEQKQNTESNPGVVEEPKTQNTDETEQDEEIGAMISDFVDAGPDAF